MTHPAIKTPLPFGGWPSPVTAELIAGATIRLGQIALRGSEIVWSEGRPQEQGRNVLVRRAADGALADLSPAPFNVRTRAHEYGGGAFALLADGGAVFSHYDDQQLVHVDAAGAAKALTHDADQRYADAIVDPARRRLIAVREDHRAGAADAVATIVSISLDTGAARVLVEGHDFLASPALSPDERQLAWLAWDHPNMPWDGCELWLADVAADGSLGTPRRIAGGAQESIFQPQWSPRGELHFVSDRSGWWNLYRLRDGATQPLHPMAAEFGEPQWAFGMSRYGFDATGRIVCAVSQRGVTRLATLDPETGAFEWLATPFCTIESLRVGADFAAFVGATPTQASAVVRLDLASGAHEVLRSSSAANAEVDFLSLAEPITFPTEGGLDAHAFFYAPTNRDARGPDGERPPLIVITHGGPTGTTDAGFKWSIQFWTSRGFAVVDVNYGGSSGYGRAYRARLDGQWGVIDVDDAIHAARFLIARGDVDADRIAIRGGSAGGYTTLSALTFRHFFKAGASHYGIGDLETLATATHKFESRYLDRLIGPYPAQRALYRARSPVHHTTQLSSPMILFQGAEDKAVPPSQAQAMYDAVAAKGLPVAYLLFEGEQHGFRRASTIRRVLEAELFFYGRVFGFAPADAIEPVEIRNLPG
ncbi:S9 family peptidase [Rhizobacter sp. Root404]|uniref:S9 family peptidase n=1 Tax=Rhizobacter sp. Root404 TaxID=1736528 RepID=UPI0007015F97|nr:S9 family peptidase [Rhizobacter sp. Root404]KQW37825.1 peptidase [Rhizobacter sp. Root404]